MLTVTELVQLLMAFTGSMGFAILFHIGRKSLLPASLGGALAWLVYLAVIHAGKGYMIASFLGAVFCGLWSELWARRLRQPATVFLISAVIPLIPGNALYQTMNSLVTGEMHAAWRWGIATVLTMVFVAMGTSFVAAVFIMKERISDKRRTQDSGRQS